MEIKKKTENPRLLVTTVSSWSVKSGADTFSTLLQGYGAEQIANIFMKSDPPTAEASGRYFNISENAVIKSVFKRNIVTGQVKERVPMDQLDTMDENDALEKKRYSFWSRHPFWTVKIAREIAWALGKWKSQELESFVDGFDPEVILFPIEQYMYFNRMNLWLLKKLHCRAIAMFWDDNFTYKQFHGNWAYNLHRFFLRKQARKIVERCDTVLTITPKTKKECDEFFGIDSIVLSKGCQIGSEPADEWRRHSAPYKIVYTGNLNIGRDKTILMLLDSLNEVNQKAVLFTLDIYSPTPLDKEIINRFKNSRFCTYHGGINQNEVKVVQEEADILLMVEALEGTFVDVSRLSFSTKAVDYLARRKCILAILPADSATKDYLKAEDAAIVVSEKEELIQELERLASVPELLEQYGAAAYKLARNKHDIAEIKDKLWAIVRGNEPY